MLLVRHSEVCGWVANGTGGLLRSAPVAVESGSETTSSLLFMSSASDTLLAIQWRLKLGHKQIYSGTITVERTAVEKKAHSRIMRGMEDSRATGEVLS